MSLAAIWAAMLVVTTGGPGPVAARAVHGTVARDTTSVRSARPAQSTTWSWELPGGFPVPKVPESNPMSAAKVELGRHLFYDTQLTGRAGFACANCHVQALAFTDGKARSPGATGELHPRSAMSLANVAYQMPLTWGDTAMRELEAQALVPMLGEHPVEMGLTGHEAEVLARLRTLPRYRQLVAAAYPDEREPLTLTHVTNALAAFQRTLLSGNSAYDRARRGNTAALSESARRGYAAFFSDKLECYQCHGGMFFSNTTDYEGRVFTPRVAAQNLYGQDKCGGPPSPTSDVHGLALSYDERNRIKAPTLRNIGVTGPYMHDGTYATLDEMMDHYGKSGQATSAFKANCSLPAQDKADLIAFLRSLTDEEFLANPKHADPWPGARTGTPVRTSFGR